jgi:hypothetical protein
MIIGLSHVIYSSNNFKNKISNLKSEGYKLKFFKKRIKNNKEKFLFMSDKNLYHDIYYFVKKNNYSIELINYTDTPKNNCRISLSKKYINLYIPRPNLEKKIFKKFFITKKNLISKNNAISKSLNFLIKLKKKKINSANYLNCEGINTIAFFCKDIKSIRDHFVKLGLECTKIFSLKLLHMKYKIFIVKSKNEIFYEFLNIV